MIKHPYNRWQFWVAMLAAFVPMLIVWATTWAGKVLSTGSTRVQFNINFNEYLIANAQRLRRWGRGG